MHKIAITGLLIFLSCLTHYATANTQEYNEAPKKALIFGLTGQDGSYLAEFLLGKGYEVHGIKRRSSSFNTARIDHLMERANKQLRSPERYQKNFFVHYGDLTDATNITRIIQEVQPDEIYNLAAQSHVQVSFDLPEYTAMVDGLGTLHILEAIRLLGLTEKTKFYQASTSELYGKVQEIPQKETTPFYPRSPYGAAKIYGYWITKNYREAYNMFTCNGILFNHESPRRGETFVTRKITRAVARIKEGLQDYVSLGNLDAKRDWGHARDYVEVMWLILQQEKPDDYIVATGETHTVREFIETAFKVVGIDILWHGKGLEEVGIDKATDKVIVKVNKDFFRPLQSGVAQGDIAKARRVLGWKPKLSFNDLINEMMQEELKSINA